MQPLVSCIMPTANRRAFVAQAIRYFLAQDYENKELVIVDDGGESVVDLAPDDPQIRYLRLERKVTLGEKRNECVRACRGDLIMHWDDDDWMAPRRISYQVEHLLEQKAEVCGLQRMLFYDPAGGAVWLYQYPPYKRPWLAGGSLLYTRDFWRRSPFPNMQVASDTRFILNRKMDRYVALPDYTFYVALIHRNNTSHKRTHGAYWKRWEGNIGQIVGADLGFYQSLYRPGESHPPGNLSNLDVRRAEVTSTSAAGSSSRGQLSHNGIPKAPADDELSARAGRRRMSEASRMRIGYVVLNFPSLSETFIRREVMALCEAGHRVFVYTCYRSRNPLTPDPAHPNLVIRQVVFARNSAALAEAARRDEVEHIHSSLMLAAHQAAFEAARTLQAPFTMTAYSGHDIFTAGDPRLLGKISNDPCCEAIIVEDPFMRDYVVEHLGAEPQKIAIIPNSFDLDLYRRREPQPLSDRIVILAIARFVEKKGLIHLVQAFNQLRPKRRDVELWLVGEGPEGARLRQAANRNPLIRFMGNLPEAETRRCYTNAHIFCIPCVRTASGDADGIPTTTLEAMAFELPVVTSNLLSTPYYVRDGQEGFLSEPGVSAALSAALERL